MRSRPEALPRFSTATNTRAARRPLSCRLPRRPAWVPPIQSIVDLHLSVERLARHIDHRSPELVEHHPRRFVSAQSQLTLEQKRGDPTFVGRHQVRGPKPQRQRGSRVMQNRPGRERHLMPAGGALPTSLSHHGICALVPAAPTREAIGPATGGQILLTGLFAGELTLKFAQVSRKKRTRHAPTLYLVAC